MGRKSKYLQDPEWFLKVARMYARKGLSEKQVAHVLGISVATLEQYKKKFPEFLKCLKENKDYADSKVENALYESACKGNITAQIFWLTNRRRNEWHRNPDDVAENAVAIPDAVEVIYD